MRKERGICGEKEEETEKVRVLLCLGPFQSLNWAKGAWEKIKDETQRRWVYWIVVEVDQILCRC